MKLAVITICFLILTSCRSDTSDTPNIGAFCSTSDLEQSMDETLSNVVSAVDFTLALERPDGRQYVFSRGDSSLQTSYESASTSKLVAAVTILRLVELGYLRLSDRPQDYISGWPIDTVDPLFAITLAQLLSFTSGLESAPLCGFISDFDFEECVINIGDINAENGVVPGESFFYANNHLQVAGAMAYRAFNGTSWQEVFEDFKTQTGLFSNAEFDIPSIENPRLAGGMHWTAEEYLAFLVALQQGDILNANSMDLLLTDHIESVTIKSSPARDGLMEDWHYGFGVWHECENDIFNCDAGERVSSPGAFGAYPFWDRESDYVGLVARQGAFGTYTTGIIIERAVREEAQQWAECL